MHNQLNCLTKKINAMKKILLYTSLFVLMFTFSQAQQTLTVSNDPNGPDPASSPHHYATIQEAVDFAAADLANHYTILVSGTPTNYGSISIDVPVTLIGAGYHPHNDFQHSSQLDVITLYNGATGTSLVGTTIKGFLVGSIICDGDDIDYISIFRNYITGEIRGSNNGPNMYHSDWQIANNIIDYVSGHNTICNSQIFNNIFTGRIEGIYYLSNITINNNIFIYYPSGVFNGVYNALINYNIFHGVSPAGAYESNFAYNVYTGPIGDFGFTPEPADNNNIAGNAPDVPANTIFLPVGVGITPGSNFEWANDYHLQTPGITPFIEPSGWQIGIYGPGNSIPGDPDYNAYIFPYAEDESPYLYRAMPDIPQIIEMTILTPSVHFSSGELQVSVKARKQD